jgi:hypothetical protein
MVATAAHPAAGADSPIVAQGAGSVATLKVWVTRVGTS